MFRGIPSTSKLLQKKWAEKEKEIHKRKLKEVRGQMHIVPPAEQKHLTTRSKPDLLKEERFTEIERENKLLLDKMTRIMKHGSQSSASIPFEKKSLNKESRKRELLKITMENQAILKRLQEKQSSYNASKWIEERKEQEKIIKNICEYPYTLQPVRSLQPAPTPRRLTNARLPEMAHRPLAHDQPLGSAREGNGKRAGVRTLIKKGRMMSNGHYLIEVSRSPNALFIAAAKMEGQENYLIELPNEKAEEILVEFGGNYEELVANLQVLNKRLVLLNPQRGPGKRKAKKRKKTNSKKDPATVEEGPEAAEGIVEESDNALALSECVDNTPAPLKKKKHTQSMPELPPVYVVDEPNEEQKKEEEDEPNEEPAKAPVR